MSLRVPVSFFIVLLLLVGGIPSPTHAQIPGVESVSVSINPQYPRPYDTITITPKSTLIDLAASEVRILANDAVIEEGSGGRTASFTLGGPGTRTVIRVVVTNAGQTYEKKVTIAPADVALVLEPNSTTHPFYLGGSLVAPEGKMRIVALPDFRTNTTTRIAPERLSYTWRVGDRILEAESGIGRSVLVATAPLRYRDATVSVTVTTVDNTIAGQARVVITPSDPILRIYRNDPLLGTDFSRAILKNFSLQTDEETFRAVPYYFTEQPAYSWLLNNVQSGNGRDLTVRTTGANSGAATIQASVIDAEGFRAADAVVNVTFGANRSPNIFGF